jgi:hypothetical protein
MMHLGDPATTPNVPAITPSDKRDPKDPNEVLLGDEDTEDDDE